jgi:flavin-dependent dehydrogenase
LWDVAILGAGPAGSACAIALARRGVAQVCVVDPGRKPGSPAIGETIPPDARLVLDQLGAWQAFLAEGHEACLGSCSSWGSEALGFNDFVFNPHGSGWHLDRARFDDFLRRCAAEAGASMLGGSRFLESKPNGEGGFRLRLRGEDGMERALDTRFVVDATGRRSAFAQGLGVRSRFLDRLTFVYGYFDGAEAASRSRLTLLEAAETGWWYAAGLPGNRLAVAFATDAEVVRTGRLAQDERWFSRLLRTRHLAPRLDGCRFLSGSLVVHGAPSFLRESVAGRSWLAIGDAAAGYDPLAAQGICKAMTDGLEAADVIAGALAAGTGLPQAFADRARARFDEYLENRNYFYGLERRWPDSAFWQRRQERTRLAAAT